jgi:FKBP-type peptidyl-prolyl cis-trans isomerase
MSAVGYRYGGRVVGPIPPNSDLVFYVELVSLGS